MPFKMEDYKFLKSPIDVYSYDDQEELFLLISKEKAYRFDGATIEVEREARLSHPYILGHGPYDCAYLRNEAQWTPCDGDGNAVDSNGEIIRIYEE